MGRISCHILRAQNMILHAEIWHKNNAMQKHTQKNFSSRVDQTLASMVVFNYVSNFSSSNQNTRTIKYHDILYLQYVVACLKMKLPWCLDSSSARGTAVVIILHRKYYQRDTEPSLLTSSVHPEYSTVSVSEVMLVFITNNKCNNTIK